MDHGKSNPTIHNHMSVYDPLVERACESAGYEYSEVANFLTELQESGITNMMAAPTFVIDEFGMSSSDARLVVSYWMDSCLHQYG